MQESGTHSLSYLAEAVSHGILPKLASSLWNASAKCRPGRTWVFHILPKKTPQRIITPSINKPVNTMTIL